MAEDDWDGWARAHRSASATACSSSATTCSSRTSSASQRGIERGVANSILVKVNQIGTLTETLDTMHAREPSRLHGDDVAPQRRDRGRRRSPTSRSPPTAGRSRPARRRAATASRSTTSSCASRRSSGPAAAYLGRAALGRRGRRWRRARRGARRRSWLQPRRRRRRASCGSPLAGVVLVGLLFAFVYPDPHVPRPARRHQHVRGRSSRCCAAENDKLAARSRAAPEPTPRSSGWRATLRPRAARRAAVRDRARADRTRPRPRPRPLRRRGNAATRPVDCARWPPSDDVAALTTLLGRDPQRRLRGRRARATTGQPVVVRNAPFTADGTPMPTRYWLVDPELNRAGVSRLEAARRRAGGRGSRRRRARSRAAHDAYAAERDAAIARRPRRPAAARRRRRHAHRREVPARALRLPASPAATTRSAAWVAGDSASDHEQGVPRREPASARSTSARTRCACSSPTSTAPARDAKVRRRSTGGCASPGSARASTAPARCAPRRSSAPSTCCASTATVARRATASTQVRATATSAARDASNRDDFFAAAHDALGVDAGAALAATRRPRCRSSARPPISTRPRRTSSSTSAAAPPSSCSAPTRPTGWCRSTSGACASPSSSCTPIRPRPRSCRTRSRSCATTSPTCQRVIPGAPEAATLVGLAGTVTTVAAVELGLPEYDPERIHHFRLTRAAAEDVFRTLATESRPRNARTTPGLEPGRVDVIVGGAVVLVGDACGCSASTRCWCPRPTSSTAWSAAWREPPRSRPRERPVRRHASSRDELQFREPGNPPTRCSFVPRMRGHGSRRVRRRCSPPHAWTTSTTSRRSLDSDTAGRRSRRVAGHHRDRPRAPSLAPLPAGGACRVGRRADRAARRRTAQGMELPDPDVTHVARAAAEVARGSSPVTTSRPRCSQLLAALVPGRSSAAARRAALDPRVPAYGARRARRR